MKVFGDLVFENGSPVEYIFCSNDIRFFVKYDDVFQEAEIRDGTVYVNSPMVNGVAELWYRA